LFPVGSLEKGSDPGSMKEGSDPSYVKPRIRDSEKTGHARSPDAFGFSRSPDPPITAITRCFYVSDPPIPRSRRSPDAFMFPIRRSPDHGDHPITR
jgi:hypothetical protein